MTRPTSAIELIAECEALDIRLAARGANLAIDAPGDKLTDDLLAQLRAHKQDILAAIQAGTDSIQDCRNSELRLGRLPWPKQARERDSGSLAAVCRCGATTWRDVVIHDGQSVRRDCAVCGRFLDFPVWYSADAVRNAQ